MSTPEEIRLDPSHAARYPVWERQRGRVAPDLSRWVNRWRLARRHREAAAASDELGRFLLRFGYEVDQQEASELVAFVQRLLARGVELHRLQHRAALLVGDQRPGVGFQLVLIGVRRVDVERTV